MSGLPGDRIDRLRNFTSGSSVSAIMKRKTRLFRGLNKKRKDKEKNSVQNSLHEHVTLIIEMKELTETKIYFKNFRS